MCEAHGRGAFSSSDARVKLEACFGDSTMTENCNDSELPLLKGSAQFSTNFLPLRCSSDRTSKDENLPDDCLQQTKEETLQYEIKPLKKRPVLAISDNLSTDDLSKLREWLLVQICNTSDLLVELLQERHRLSEEVHARLISIEQLHRLLEARCYYRGLSTGLFS